MLFGSWGLFEFFFFFDDLHTLEPSSYISGYNYIVLETRRLKNFFRFDNSLEKGYVKMQSQGYRVVKARACERRTDPPPMI